MIWDNDVSGCWYESGCWSESIIYKNIQTNYKLYIEISVGNKITIKGMTKQL
jgi:hypothetical protein